MSQHNPEAFQALEARVAELEDQVARLWTQVQVMEPVEPAPVQQFTQPQQISPGAPIQWSQPDPAGWGAPAGPQEHPWTAEAGRLKASGRAIEAIKVVRDATGWGLKESKDYVDRL